MLNRETAGAKVLELVMNMHRFNLDTRHQRVIKSYGNTWSYFNQFNLNITVFIGTMHSTLYVLLS